MKSYWNFPKIAGLALVALSLALFAASRRGSATGKYRCDDIEVYNLRAAENLRLIEKFAEGCQPGTLTMVPGGRLVYGSSSFVRYYVACCIH